MSGQRRRRLDAGTWHELLRRFDAGAATVVEFCASEGLNTSSFYRWRERLQSSGAQAVAHGVQASGISVPPSGAGFIDLGDLADASRGAGGGLEVRLDLGGGLVLQITRR